MTARGSEAAFDSETRRLEAALLEWIASAPAGFVQEGADPSSRYGLDAAASTALERRFESLALDLFAYQYERVPVYRAYAEAQGASPSRVRRAALVPALPVEAFRRTRVAGFPESRERAAFHTSGTSAAQPGILHLDRLDLYDLALERGFRHHVLPDIDCIRMLILAPAAAEAPHSSLSYMLERVRRRWGTRDSGAFVRDGALQWPDLARALRRASAVREPVCVLGTGFAWVHVLEACERERFAVALPAGSRLFETGGFKGRSRVLDRGSLMRGFENCFGVPATRVVSEYGMTEMGSQLYTLGLRQELLGRPAPEAGWSYPAWLRPRLVDSESGECFELERAREVGLIAQHDLANRSSVAHLLTSDLGRARGCSFELLGRAPRADLRGCGLVAETWRVEGSTP